VSATESQSRTRLLLGDEALARLASAHVAVAGLGAVGSFAVEALARAGVGHLRLADVDCARESNLNRQLYALHSTLGRPKAELAAERVRDIQPDCEVEALQLFVHRESLDRFLEGPPDVVIDAIDSFAPKVELLDASVKRGIAIVSCLGAARRTDPFALRVADLAETRVCPMAYLLRKALRKRQVTTGVRCIFSLERAAGSPIEPLSPPEDEPYRRGRTRAPMGSLVTVVAIAGLLAAHEAIALLTGLPPAGTSPPVAP
jgi:tRNA threonylcarbamoyladenosine dehydratase